MANPRHLILNHSGTKLYVSFNRPGKIAELDLEDVLNSAPNFQHVTGRIIGIGKGARTIALSQDDLRLYAVCNTSSTLTCIDLKEWKVIDSIHVAPYAVGLAINNDETLAVVTSQGKRRHGGNNVAIYNIH